MIKLPKAKQSIAAPLYFHTMTGRFAPTPSGYMHIGNASTALLSWLHVKSLGGKIVLRIEDIDSQRCKKKYTKSIFEDLSKMGLNWDGEPLFQSDRDENYQSVLNFLIQKDLVFACSCNRKMIRKSIPNKDSKCYQGTCIKKNLPLDGPYSLRLKTWKGYPVIRRSDKTWSYNFVVVIDDAFQKVTHIVRGADLQECDSFQEHFRELLGYESPSIHHAPIWLGPGGQKLSKKDGPISLKDYFHKGWSPEPLLGAIAAGLNLKKDKSPCSANYLINSLGSYDWNKSSVYSSDFLPLSL